MHSSAFKRSAFFGVWLCISFVSLASGAAPGVIQDSKLNDGPYVTRSGHDLDVSWICSGQLFVRRVAVRGQATTIAPLCGYERAVVITGPNQIENGLAHRTQGRLLAVSDVHGQFDLLVRLLRKHRLIDRRLRWRGGADTLVVVGDMLDRGPKVTETYWLLYSLQQQAPAFGGAVHVLLGNHEAIELSGYLRYLNPKYKRVEELAVRSYPDLYGANTVLGQWLRTRPVMLLIDDLLFLHGGIAPENEEMAADVAGTNAAYQAVIGLPRAQTRSKPELEPLFDTYRSPIWYRGYMNGELSTDYVSGQLARLGVSQIIVGHTTLERISSFHNKQVIGIDAGLKEGSTGEVLIIQRDGRFSRGLLNGALAEVLEEATPVLQSAD